MVRHDSPRTIPTCVWMNAGLLTFKLCDRNLDCEHCPLDAALRGHPRSVAFEDESRSRTTPGAMVFPADCRFSTGHIWVRAMEAMPERIQIGLDGFIASYLPRPLGLRRIALPHQLHPGEAFCEIEFGFGDLPVTSPVQGNVSRWNDEVGDNPDVLLADPYGAGWIAELIPASADEIDSLLSPDSAEEQARLDARRFRRRLAMHLLADDKAIDDGSPANGWHRTDLGRLLSGEHSLALLRELTYCPC